MKPPVNLADALLRVQGEVEAAGGDLDRALLSVVAGLLAAIPGAEGATAEQVDGEAMVYRTAAGASAPFIGLRIPRIGSLAGLCVEEAAALVAHDTEADERVNREACRLVGARSLLAVPLFRRGEAAGVLKLQASRPNAFGADDIGVAKLFAGTLAAGFANAAEQAAETDRRAVEARLLALSRASNDLFFRMNADWSELQNIDAGGWLAEPQLPLHDWLATYVPEAERPRVRESVQRGLAAGTLIDIEHRVFLADGSIGWARSRAVPVVNGSGRIVEWFGTATDVTERRRVEERLRRVLDGMGDGFVLIDRAFRVIDINPGALRFETCTAADIIGKTHWEAWPGTEHAEQGRLYREAMASGTPVAARVEYTWPDGVTRLFDVNAYPVSDGLAIFYRDISEREQARERLEDTEATLATVLEALPLGVIVADADGRLTRDNAANRELWGVPPETNSWEEYGEWVGWWPDTGERIKPEEWAMSRALLSGETVHGELVRLQPFGGTETRYILNNAAPIRNACGSVVGGVVAQLDVTDQIAADQALKDSEARFRLLAETIDEVFYITDLDNEKLLYVSPAYERLWGRPVADLGDDPRNYALAIHPDDRALVAAGYEQQARGEPAYAEYRIVRPDCAIRWIADASYPVVENGHRFAAGSAKDITARHAVEDALRESEQRFRTIADSAPVPMWVTRLDRKREFVNRAYCDFLGVTYAEATDFDWRTRIHPDDVERITAESIAGEASLKPFTLEGRYLDAAGELRWLRSESHPRFDGNGALIGFIGAAYDVTIAKEAEVRLQALLAERTADRNAVWQMSKDLMLRCTFTADIKAVNPAWTELLGWREDELLGANLFAFIHPDDHEATVRASRDLARGTHHNRFDNRYRHKDGGYRWIAWSTRPAEGLINAVGRDVTDEIERQAELERTQEALRQSQKLEAMGQLTGGVAHDFNNLLTPIVGSLDLLLRRNPDERAQRMIGGALQAAERAKTLVQRLLAFARRQPLQPTAIDVGALVRGMADLVDSTTGPQVRVAVDLAEPLPPAHADANQVEMAILNLAVNARDAMPDGGTLTIAAEPERVADGGPQGLAPGDYLRLSVTDTGTGMDAETLKRAVEPFFSTKGIGKGTGLGLSMVHGLAEQLGGALKVASRPGVGTRIDIWLPVAEAVPDHAGQAPAAGRQTGHGTVLLVDDEELVRASVADMLQELGYTVVEADSGEAALARVAQGLTFDLLVTDHLMPGLTGADLAHELAVRRPGTPALIVSGYADADGLAPDLPRLLKPFDQAALAAAVGELLGEAQEGMVSPAGFEPAT